MWVFSKSIIYVKSFIWNRDIQCRTSYIALASHAEGMVFESQPQQINVVQICVVAVPNVQQQV